MNNQIKRIENLERRYGIGRDDKPVIVSWKSVNRAAQCKIGDLRQMPGETFDAFLQRACDQNKGKDIRSLWLENVDYRDALPGPESFEPQGAALEAIRRSDSPDEPPMDELTDDGSPPKWWH